MPPAARGLPPSGLLSGGNNSPRAPSAPPYPAQACACTGYGGSVGVGHPFSGCRNGAAGKLFFKERRIGMPFPRPAPLTKVLGGRGMGVRGKGFLPLPPHIKMLFAPRGVALVPERVERLRVTQGIHALPETGTWKAGLRRQGVRAAPSRDHRTRLRRDSQEIRA